MVMSKQSNCASNQGTITVVLVMKPPSLQLLSSLKSLHLESFASEKGSSSHPETNQIKLEVTHQLGSLYSFRVICNFNYNSDTVRAILWNIFLPQQALEGTGSLGGAPGGVCATSQMTKGCFVTRFCSRPLLPAAIGEPQEVRTLKRSSFHKKFVEVYLINNKLHTFKTHNLINFDMCRKNFTIKIINISLPPPNFLMTFTIYAREDTHIQATTLLFIVLD